ncbi:MAG TPA: hypothetical protein G4O00_12155 [Thermoflexia bacterium]|nr:hypothetical protein [Thermoflexia bacterium]
MASRSPRLESQGILPRRLKPRLWVAKPPFGGSRLSSSTGESPAEAGLGFS